MPTSSSAHPVAPRPKTTKKKKPLTIKSKKTPSKSTTLKPKEEPRKNLENLTGDDGDIDFERLIREEFARLHRKYRLMEEDRSNLTGKSNSMSRQNKILKVLMDQRDDLETDYENVADEKYRIKDADSVRTILGFLEEIDGHEEKVREVMKDMCEMEKNVDLVTKRLVEQKLKVQASYGNSMTVPQADKRKSVLEDKLYLTTTQFDTLISKSKALINEVNMMLKTRKIFFDRLMAIKKKSAKMKRRVNEIVDLATQAYDQRDDDAKKIRLLIQRNEKESKSGILEMKECRRLIYHHEKLEEFLDLKNKERELSENAIQRKERKTNLRVNELQLILRKYRRSLTTIFRMCNTGDIDLLIHEYEENVQGNMATFRVLLDLNHEISLLRDETLELAAHIEEQYIAYKASRKDQRAKMEAASAHTKANNATIKKLDGELIRYDEQMVELAVSLERALVVAEANRAPLFKLLGQHKGITPKNLLLCFKLLENRVAQLQHTLGATLVRQAVEIGKEPLPKKTYAAYKPSKQKNAGGPFMPTLIVSGYLDNEEDEDEDKAFLQAPIFMEEMRTRVLSKMDSSKFGKSEVKNELHGYHDGRAMSIVSFDYLSNRTSNAESSTNQQEAT